MVGIPLNVISTYALLETGWKTVLGNAEESGLFLKKLKLPLKISERAWWLKVSLLSKHKSGVKGSGPAPMDLSTVNTGNTVNTDVNCTSSVMFSGVLHYILYPLNILAQGGIHCIIQLRCFSTIFSSLFDRCCWRSCCSHLGLVVQNFCSFRCISSKFLFALNILPFIGVLPASSPGASHADCASRSYRDQKPAI